LLEYQVDCIGFASDINDDSALLEMQEANGCVPTVRMADHAEIQDETGRENLGHGAEHWCWGANLRSLEVKRAPN
jgi:hypothetical protein